MGRSLNKVQLIGNTGDDPEIRTTNAGTMLAKLSLATNRSYKDRTGQKQEEVQWHRITAFGKLAEIIEQYVTKGDRLYIEGRIEYSQTEDEHGGKRFWTDIIADQLIMLGGNPAPTASGARGPYQDPEGSDLPFS